MQFLCIVLIVVSVLLLTGGYVFFTACRRKEDLPWFDKEKLSKTAYGKYYECIQDADKWLKDHNGQDIYTKSKDGLRLCATWVPAQNPIGTMLLCHGYRSTKLLDFGVAFPFYHEMGMNLLIPDQRCHGKSEGKYITFGVKESNDMLCWLKHHNENYGNYPVFLSGLSMGASTVKFMADEQLPSNVKGIIADCGFSSPKEILSAVFKKRTHLPATLIMPFIDLYARIFAGFHLSGKDSRKVLLKNKLPILFVHGKKDNFVPCSMTEAGYAACAGEKELLIVENAGHGVSFLVEPDRYRGKLVEFINKHIGDKRKD